MKKNRRIALLMLPILAVYLFQATQYARAPVKYNFYVVYAKNADIALKPGSDLSPNGENILQNATGQQGLYNLTLGQWGPGYRINYTEAFNVTNMEKFAIKMFAANFSSDSTGQAYLRVYVYNDTDQDGYGDSEVLVWDGTASAISTSNYIYFTAATTYGNDGGTCKVKMEVRIPETEVTIQGYSGTLYLWFISG